MVMFHLPKDLNKMKYLLLREEHKKIAILPLLKDLNKMMYHPLKEHNKTISLLQ